MTTTDNAEEIQQEMRQVRRELTEDMQEIVDNARVMTDWRYYIRTYPWAAVGAAAVIGYWLVPSKSRYVGPDAAAIGDIMKAQIQSVQSSVEKNKTKGITATIVGLAGSALLQGGIALGRQQLSKFMNSQMSSTEAEGPK